MKNHKDHETIKQAAGAAVGGVAGAGVGMAGAIASISAVGTTTGLLPARGLIL